MTSSLQSLCRYERKTRLNESIHLIGFIGFTVLAAIKFAAGSLTGFGLTVALERSVPGMPPRTCAMVRRLGFTTEG